MRLYLRLKFYANSLSCSNAMYAYIIKLYYLSDAFKSLCNSVNLNKNEYGLFSSLPIRRLRAAVNRTFEASLD